MLQGCDAWPSFVTLISRHLVFKINPMPAKNRGSCRVIERNSTSCRQRFTLSCSILLYFISYWVYNKCRVYLNGATKVKIRIKARIRRNPNHGAGSSWNFCNSRILVQPTAFGIASPRCPLTPPQLAFISIISNFLQHQITKQQLKPPYCSFFSQFAAKLEVPLLDSKSRHLVTSM